MRSTLFRIHGWSLFVMFVCISFSNCSPKQSSKIEQSRALPMPSVSILSSGEIEAAGQISHTLRVIPHSGEEPAVGPDSFSVLDDGSLLISDPAQNRRAHFAIVDSRAVFQSQMPLPRGNNISAASAYDQGNNDKARLVSDTTGIIRRTFPDNSVSDLEVLFDDKKTKLVSILSLGTDEIGSTYVVLETAGRSSIVNVGRSIRKYSRSGRVVAEIDDLPQQKEISPQPEFQMKNGIVYQMVVSTDGVLINRWDMRENK